MKGDDGQEGTKALPQSKASDPLFEENGVCDVVDREGLLIEGTHDLADGAWEMKGFHQGRDLLEGCDNWVSKLKVSFPLDESLLDRGIRDGHGKSLRDDRLKGLFWVIPCWVSWRVVMT